MTDIVEKVRQEVIKRNYDDKNIFGKDVYEFHIKSVEKNAIKLAKEYGADVQIVQIASLLHDIASITDVSFYKEHHIIGAKIAEELLNEYGYSKDKIVIVKNCILNHRGSIINNKNTIEEVCIADADAISHFYNIESLFHLVYHIKNMEINEGKEYLRNKLTRSYNKLSNKSKEIYKEKYFKTMSIFEEE